MKTKLLIEQHFHGAFGVDFSTAGVDDVLYLAQEIRKHGIGGIFPTLVTDGVENIKRQTKIIKQAAERQTPDMARILGIHLEGIFLNPLKKGIHDEKLFLPLTQANFDLVADDFIKIITFAPELSTFHFPLSIKKQAGHCVGADLTDCDGVTHIFNAMEGVSHRAPVQSEIATPLSTSSGFQVGQAALQPLAHGSRAPSTALTALIDDRLYAEVIADGAHLSDDILRLIFKTKPADKIILISDSLPCAGTGEGCTFADTQISADGKNAAGTLAGSTMLLPEIIRDLAKKGLFNPQFIENPYIYHKIDIKGEIEWDEEFNII